MGNRPRPPGPQNPQELRFGRQSGEGQSNHRRERERLAGGIEAGAISFSIGLVYGPKARLRTGGAGHQEEEEGVTPMHSGRASSSGTGRMPRSPRVNACLPTTLSRFMSFT